MEKKFYSLFIFFLVSYCSFSQGVGIGTTTPDASAALDISATNKGLLIPRMDINSINAIASPARGLLVFDSVANLLMVNTGTPAAPNWRPVTGNGSNNAWSLTGNGNINPLNNFIGTTDSQPLRFRINNIGAGELNPVNNNVTLGMRAGQANTTGFGNVAIGDDALKSNTDGFKLVAIGDSALSNNRGSDNTAIGAESMAGNTTGGSNTAVGKSSLFSNTTGSINVATGSESLFSNTTGSGNTSAGAFSLFGNTTGVANTAIGVLALSQNTIGNENTAVGFSALASNTGGLGQFNTAVGNNALLNTRGSQFNTAIGYRAGFIHNMGFNNTMVGANADVLFADIFNAVSLGQSSLCTASNQVRFGNTFTSSIGGFVGYSNLSDGRFKKNIQESVKGIDFIMKLRPVMYQWDLNSLNQELYPGKKMDESSNKNAKENGTTTFSGFVAQEVEQAAKDARYDFSGVDKPKNEKDMYGLRYADFVVPLVKAVQEQQQMISELQKQNAELHKRVVELEKK